ncbi:MAG: hypothetical protein LC777_21320, partial [Actinobacteria bacterium]|nr:hypothetical protein [Actinomycetota bacterium]
MPSASKAGRARSRPARGSPRSRRDSAAPPAKSSFLGREEQLAELEELLGRARLLTLTGAPGIGKSRLALELGKRVGGT